MDEPGDRRTVLRRVLVATLCSLLAASVAAALSVRPLDVALYAVLAPIAAVALLMAAPAAVRILHSAHRRPVAPSVVPEPSEPSQPVDVMLTPLELTLARARERLVAAGAAGTELSELLSLSTALHEVAVDLARVTLARGGEVPQALRDELAMRDRADQVESTAPVV